MPNIETFLDESNDIPSLPEIYIRITELLDSEYSTAEHIGDALQTDLSLSSCLLKLVNSAFYGLSKEITSIPQAVTLLGRSQLRNLLTGSVLTGLFNHVSHERFSLHDFWMHSIKTAIIARHLAMQNASIIDHDAFFTAGLLHDIGRLIIVNVDAKAHDDIQHLIETGLNTCEAEQQILGFHHADLGKALLQHWRLPSMLIQCVAKHHDVDHQGPFKIDTSIIYLANSLSRHEQPATEDDARLILQHIPNWETSECTLEQIPIACQLAEEQVREVMESLGMSDINLDNDPL